MADTRMPRRRGPRPTTGHHEAASFTTRLPRGVLAELHDVSRATGMPRWQIVDAAIRDFLAAHRSKTCSTLTSNA